MQKEIFLESGCRENPLSALWSHGSKLSARESGEKKWTKQENALMNFVEVLYSQALDKKANSLLMVLGLRCWLIYFLLKVKLAF